MGRVRWLQKEQMMEQNRNPMHGVVYALAIEAVVLVGVFGVWQVWRWLT